MYEIKITVEIPGLPEALIALANALKLQLVKPDMPIKQIGDENKAVETVSVKPAVVEVTPAIQPEAAVPAQPVVEAKSYTLDELSRAGAALIDQGKMAELINLLGKYGVNAVTQLSPDVYPTFAEDMKALGAKF